MINRLYLNMSVNDRIKATLPSSLRSFFGAFIAIPCLSLISSPGIAETSMDNLLSMTLEELTRVEITGSTLTPESINSVPSAVTVYTYQQIKRMGLDSLDELINIVPGFQSYRSTRSSINMATSSRGRRIANAGAEILLIIDGQRLNDPRTGGSFLLTPKLPLMQIERVEFIRGPGSAIYGSNAMLGVVNIITRSGVNEVGISGGSFNRSQAYLQTSQNTKNFSLDLFAYFDKDKGQDFLLPDTFNSTPVETNDPRELANINLKLNWKNTYLNLQHNQSLAEDFYEQNVIANGANKRKAKISFISLKQDFDWQAINSSVQLSYSTSQFYTASKIAPPIELSADFDNYNETQFKWHNNWKIKDHNNLQFGIELRYIDAPQTQASSNNPSFDGTPVQEKSTRNIAGAYLQYQQIFFEKTQLTMGLRYDDFSDIGNELNPRLGIVQPLNDHHSLKLLYGHAYRAPTENELNLINNPVLLGNPNLKPESVDTWDFIWIGQWQYTNISVGYFENHFDDSIIRKDNGDGTTQFQNSNQGPSKGFEIEISHEINNHWLLNFSQTYFTEIPENSIDEAELFGSVMLNYQRSQWNANLIASYFDQRITLTEGANNTPLTLDSYWQLFAKLSYNFTKELKTFVQIKNLLDEDYQSPTASSRIDSGTPNRGQEILLGLIWEF